MCTNMEFNFQTQKWSDGDSLEEPDFIQKWKNKFGSFWDNWENNFPYQPYIPVIATVGYRKIESITASQGDLSLFSPFDVSFDSLSDMDVQKHFICHNSSSFKHGTYEGNLEVSALGYAKTL